MTPETIETEVRVASPAEMTGLIRDAKKEDFNRQIDEEVIAKFSPTGINFVIPTLVHENKGGEPTEPHYRCRVLLSFKDEPTMPREYWLDVQIKNFDQLRTLKEAKTSLLK